MMQSTLRQHTIFLFMMFFLCILGFLMTLNKVRATYETEFSRLHNQAYQELYFEMPGINEM